MTKTERFALSLLCLAAILVALSGCRGSRVIEVQGEAPPPTVQTVTDTLVIGSPPDTVFLPGPEVVVTETVPVEVVRYLAPRPDTSRAYLLWHLSVDSARVEVSGADSDASFRRPEPGEALVCVARGPSDLECRVEGEPVKPKAQRFECPGCPDALFLANLRGWLTLLVVLGVVAGAAFVAGRITA